MLKPRDAEKTRRVGEHLRSRAIGNVLVSLLQHHTMIRKNGEKEEPTMPSEEKNRVSSKDLEDFKQL